MQTIKSNTALVLGIALSSRGFGFAVFEGPEKLVDWGVKSIQGDKNAGSIKKLKEILDHYRPAVIVLEDASSKGSRRSVRIRALSESIIALGMSLDIKVKLISRERVLRSFFAQGRGTKHTLAELLAASFPEELANRLPPKRRPWMSEDYRMDIFVAVALALASVKGS